MAKTLKKCSLCEQEKPLKEFGIDRIFGRRGDVCRECSKRVRKEIFGESEIDKPKFSKKLELLIEDMRIRMQEYGTNPHAIAIASEGRVSQRAASYALTDTLNNEPRFSTLEILCELLDLDLYIYAVPKTDQRYKRYYTRNYSGSKVCARCHKEKPYWDFSKSLRTEDGLQLICKDCERAQITNASIEPNTDN